MMQQMALDLFPSAASSPLDAFLSWARQSPHWDAECDGLAERVFASMPDPFDRCKAIVSVVGYGDRCAASDVERWMGIMDASLDYHVVWDRWWAFAQGVPLELLPRVAMWDYALKQPMCAAAFMEVAA